MSSAARRRSVCHRNNQPRGGGERLVVVWFGASRAHGIWGVVGQAGLAVQGKVAGGGEAESGRLLLIFCGDSGFVPVPRPGSFVQMKLHIKR